MSEQQCVADFLVRVLYSVSVSLHPLRRKPVIRFRNYRPTDPALLSVGVVLPQPALPSTAIKEAEQAELARLLSTPVSSHSVVVRTRSVIHVASLPGGSHRSNAPEKG